MNYAIKLIATPILVAMMSVPSAGTATGTMQSIGEIPKEISPQELKIDFRTTNKYGLRSDYEKEIKETFGADGKIMVAVAIAESQGGNPKAKGFNCEYTDENGKKYSTACKKMDRDHAWSVDCGLMQINTRSSNCPEDLLDPHKNIVQAKKIYDSMGKSAWAAYTNGLYLKYIDFDS